MKRIITVDIDLLPNLGEQIEDTVEELQGAILAIAAEYGAINKITVSDPMWENPPEVDHVVEVWTIRKGALS